VGARLPSDYFELPEAARALAAADLRLHCYGDPLVARDIAARLRLRERCS